MKGFVTRTAQNHTVLLCELINFPRHRDRELGEVPDLAGRVSSMPSVFSHPAKCSDQVRNSGQDNSILIFVEFVFKPGNFLS